MARNKENILKNIQKIISVLIIFSLAFTSNGLFSVAFSANTTVQTLGVWWWDISDVTNDRCDVYLDYAADNNVTEIYLCIDKMDNSAGVNFQAVRNFVKKAGTLGMRVSALSGDASWIIPGNNGFSAYVSKFNEYQITAAIDEKFYAMHLDVEPNGLDGGYTHSQKIQWYADFILNKAVPAASASSTQLECDVSAWFSDVVTDANNNSRVLAELLAEVCDTICVMSYRDTAEKMYDISKEEITYANKHGSKIVLASEMYSEEGDAVSYMEEGKIYMLDELDKLRQKLIIEVPSGNFGLAIHNIKLWYDSNLYGYDIENRLSAFETAAHFIDQKGEVWVWGGRKNNNYGQFGITQGNISGTPVRIWGASGATAVSGGIKHTQIVSNSGISGIGYNGAEKTLGLGNEIDKTNQFISISEIEDIVSVKSGKYHNLALARDEFGSTKLYSWGKNDLGQMGCGQLDKPSDVYSITTITDKIKSINASADASSALTQKGDVYVWGRHVGTKQSQLVPLKLGGLQNIIQISQSYNHMLALEQNGQLWGIGENKYGELGKTSVNNHEKTPVKIQTPVPVSKLAGTGENFSAFIGTDGYLYTNGLNNSGQLGNGSISSEHNPQFSRVIGLPKVIFAKAGKNFMLAVDEQGQIYSWGGNDCGQLGVSNKLAYRSTPAIISGINMIENKHTEPPISPDVLVTTHDESAQILYNPYMGPTSWHAPLPGNNTPKLGFVLFTWRDIETTKGVIDFDKIEQKLKPWRDAGGTVVFRFVTDYTNRGMSIPDWLYDETKDGIHYTEYGGGYEPNYNNQVFIDAHSSIIKRLGERYNNDDVIDIVQFGSIGHWGEFHAVNFPNQATTKKYIAPYMKYFSNKNFAYRRVHSLAWKDAWTNDEYPNKNSTSGEYVAGIFNDILGNTDSIGIFNGALNGGQFDYTVSDGKESYPGMPDVWKTHIMGGEVSSIVGKTHELDWFNQENYKYTKEQHKLLHISYSAMFVPTVDDDTPTDIRENILDIVKHIGYRFGVRKVETKKDIYNGASTDISLTFENTGFAPFYKENWKLEISLIDNNGNIVKTDIIDEDIRKWLPGQKTVINHKMQIDSNITAGDYKIAVAIKNHNQSSMNKNPALKLANKSMQNTEIDVADVIANNYIYEVANVYIKNAPPGSGGGGGQIVKPTPGVTSTPPPTDKIIFKDIASHWAEKYITAASAKGIIDGYIGSDGTRLFLPENSVTRAEFVKILANISGDELFENGENIFADVTSNQWFFKYVSWANKNGIAYGYYGNFSPQEYITRQETAVMLKRFINYTGLSLNVENTNTSFIDQQFVDEWARDAVIYMQRANIFCGDDLGRFNPKSKAKRAETVTTIMRMLDKKPTASLN